MIRVENLRKSYGENEAVAGISFEARPGEIFGLLGPNGAGKTTTISVISGLLSATAGSVLVDGRTMTPSASEVKKVMGVVPQEVALYEELTARENLNFWGGLYGLAGDARKRRVNETLEQIGLTDRAGDTVKTFSGGMKRRLNLGVGLVHDPRVILLDEPTVGVDPQARLNIVEVIRGLAAAGRTVLYTTHYMQEAEELCARLAIMDHGRILAEGSVAELTRMVGEGAVIAVSGTFEPEDFRHALNDSPEVQVVALESGKALLSVGEDARAPQVLAHLMEQKLKLDEVAVREPSLEQVFIKLTGRELRD